MRFWRWRERLWTSFSRLETASDFCDPSSVSSCGENGRASRVTPRMWKMFPLAYRGGLIAVSRSLYGVAGAEARLHWPGRATQLLDWQRNHRFCGRCATPTTMKTTEFAMECTACGLLAYPRISPAVMVLVRRGKELLLARSPHFRPGCVQRVGRFCRGAGETLEQCAVRVAVGARRSRDRDRQSSLFPKPALAFSGFSDAGLLCRLCRRRNYAPIHRRSRQPAGLLAMRCRLCQIRSVSRAA